MSKKMCGFLEYDAQKAKLEQQHGALVQSRLELLLNQHPAVKSIREEAQRVRTKARKASAIILYGHVLNSATMLAQIDNAEKDTIEQCLTHLEPELKPKVQREVSIEIARENIHNLAICGIRFSQGHEGYLQPDEKEHLYQRLLAELEQISEQGKDNYFRQQLPELQQLSLYKLPFHEEKIPVLKKVLRKLAQKKYISQNNEHTLLRLLILTERRQIQPPIAATTSRTAAALGPKIILDSERIYSADTLNSFEEELKNLVGETYATALLEQMERGRHLDISSMNRYLKTVRRIQEEIQRNPRQLTERYGPTPKNVERYASLDAVLQLKAELFQHTRGEPNAAGANNAGFDLENYKDRLLERAGLDTDVARAYTEGKNGRIIGQNNYMPRRHFKSNAKRKAPPDKFHQQGDAIFDELVKMGAIVCKQRGRDLYSLNPHLDTIKNSFLREYMRVTVHYNKILRQEGSVRPLIAL